jgi:hypothetical protein
MKVKRKGGEQVFIAIRQNRIKHESREKEAKTGKRGEPEKRGQRIENGDDLSLRGSHHSRSCESRGQRTSS